MKYIFALLTMAFCLSVQAQPKDTTHYYYDTAKTLIWYVINHETGNSTTIFSYRVTVSRMDFVQPTADDLKKDSLTLRKVKVPIGSTYYVPVNVLDSAATKKQRKNVYRITMIPLAADLILYDFNKNLDQFAKKLTPADTPTKKETDPHNGGLQPTAGGKKK